MLYNGNISTSSSFYEYDSENKLIKYTFSGDRDYDYLEIYSYNSSGQLSSITEKIEAKSDGSENIRYTKTFGYIDGLLSSVTTSYPNNSRIISKAGQTETVLFSWGYIIVEEPNDETIIIDVTDEIYPQF